MSYIDTQVIENQKTKIVNHLRDLGIQNVRREILFGLKTKQKHISSKFFYDEKGSNLFKAITKLPEYYPTRTEKKILNEIAPQLMTNFQNTDIVELGSGDCTKIGILMKYIPKENLSNIKYIPIDISQSAISDSAQNLIDLYPDLTINGLVADFINQLDLVPSEKKRMFLFLGSTLGNFNEQTSNEFLVNISNSMNYGDTFLLGLDLVKPNQVLHEAYNDSQNITADFNKNILNVVNEIIETDFNTSDFEHEAFFNKEESRIEMHLIAKKDMSISSPYSTSAIKLQKGEKIHTENSYKYSFDKITGFQKITKLKIKEIFTDQNDWFSLILFEK